MRTLAQSNIEHSWRKFFAASAVLAGVSILFYLMAGPLLAKIDSIGEIEREINADLIITMKIESNARDLIAASSEFNVSYLNPIIETKTLLHPNISNVEPVYNIRSRSSDFWKLPNLQMSKVVFHIVNTDPNSMNFPETMNEDFKGILSIPGNAVITSNKAKNYGVKLGSKIESKNNSLTIAGISNDFSQGTSAIFISKQTATMIGEDQQTVFAQVYLVELNDTKSLDETRLQLYELLDDENITISTPENRAKFLGWNFILSNLRGLLIANLVAMIVICLIAGQTMRSLLLTYSSEFGALRALGINNGELARIAMEQAFWLGLFSLALSLIFTMFLKYWFEHQGIYFLLPLWLVISVSITTILIAFLSGVFSLSALLKVDPIELLR